MRDYVSQSAVITFEIIAIRGKGWDCTTDTPDLLKATHFKKIELSYKIIVIIDEEMLLVGQWL